MLSSRLVLALPLVVALLACGTPSEQSASEADILAESRLVVHGTLQAQTWLHDSVSDKVPQVAWSFSGHAGDVVAPDVWPTAKSTLKPTLTLLGPAVAGKRPVLATGTPRGQSDTHLAIDGFHLPKNGSYLVLVGEAAPGKGGQFTLRLWSNANHAPRIESAQLDLALRTSASMTARIGQHAAGGASSAAPWTDADVNGALSEILGERSALVAISDAEQLVLALQQARDAQLASDDQLTRARQTAAALVGRPSDFAKAPPQQQAFALFWLGRLSQLVFAVRDVPAAEAATMSGITSQIGALVASWPGSVELGGQRLVREFSLGGAVYGYAADWAAEQADTDGTKVFNWFSADYFDAAGNWLGEQSAGASEPDDD